MITLCHGRDRSGRRLGKIASTTAGFDLGCRTLLHGRRSRTTRFDATTPECTSGGAARAGAHRSGSCGACTSTLPFGRQGPQPLGSDRGVSAFRPYPRGGLPAACEGGARFYPQILAREPRRRLGVPYTLSYSAINPGSESKCAPSVSKRSSTGSAHAPATTSTRIDRRRIPRGRGCGRGVSPAMASCCTTGQTPCSHVWDRRAARSRSSNSTGVRRVRGVEGRYLDRVVLRVLRYEQPRRPDPDRHRLRSIAWTTRFNSAGLRSRAARAGTGILQMARCETKFIAPPGVQLVGRSGRVRPAVKALRPPDAERAL